MKNLALTVVLLCSMSGAAHAAEAVFGMPAVNVTTSAADNRAQPWLGAKTAAKAEEKRAESNHTGMNSLVDLVKAAFKDLASK